MPVPDAPKRSTADRKTIMRPFLCALAVVLAGCAPQYRAQSDAQRQLAEAQRAVAEEPIRRRERQAAEEAEWQRRKAARANKLTPDERAMLTPQEIEYLSMDSRL